MSIIGKITKLQEGTRKIKNGSVTQAGVYVTITNVETGDERKPEFLSEYHNADLIEDLKKFGVGSEVKCSYTKNGNWTNLTKVEASDGTTGAAPPTEPDSGTAVDEQQPTSMLPAIIPEKHDTIRLNALDRALDFLRTLTMLSKDERFKKVLLPTKTTSEILEQMALDTASKFTKFIKGELGDTVESDTSDLKVNDVELEQPELPPDDDDPF